MKKDLPNYYFVLLPEFCKIEEIPEDILWDVGYVKRSKIKDQDNLRAIFEEMKNGNKTPVKSIENNQKEGQKEGERTGQEEGSSSEKEKEEICKEEEDQEKKDQ